MSSQFTKVPSWSSTPNAELPLANAVEKQEVNHLNAEQAAAIEVLTGRNSQESSDCSSHQQSRKSHRH